jgi:hybrid cluster-associated redox disulfide protein
MLAGRMHTASTRKPVLSLDLIVGEVLNDWPQTIPVFMDFRLGCVGCVMAQFDTLRDICRIYGLPAPRLLEELEKAIQAELT